MLRTSLQSLFYYNDWANACIVHAARGLSDEQWRRPFELGPGSLHQTLAHVYGAERIWFERCNGPGAEGLRRSRELTALTEIEQALGAVSAARSRWLAGLEEGDLRRDVTYQKDERIYRQGLEDILLQVCNHGTHHRAQAANMLKKLGAEPPILDLLFMRIKQPESPSLASDLATIRTYFVYTDWAVDRLLGLFADLNDAQLDRSCDIGLGSPRRTVLHLLDAERWWYGNWHIGAEHRWQDSDPQTPLTQIHAQWNALKAQRNAYISKQQELGLDRPVSTQPFEGKVLTFTLGESLLQLCCHSTHHRAQLMNMLRHQGVDPPALDYIAMPRGSC